MSIIRTYLDLEVTAADRVVGVDGRDNSAEVAGMISERMYEVEGVAKKVGLLLLAVEEEKVERVEKEKVVVLLLCSILVTVVMIDEALQDK